MPQIANRSTSGRTPLPFWNLPSADELGLQPASRPAPPIDDHATAIDELAFLLATDHMSTLEKIWLLEQWRYDMLQLDVAAGEGFGAGAQDGALLQQVNKALLLLARHRSPQHSHH